MTRAKKSDIPDLKFTHSLSEDVIDRLKCPAGVLKAFLRDKDVTGLRVRVTAKGAKSFVYEAKLNGKAISRTLGKFPLMTIEEAKDQARELARTVKNDKQDPREIERQQQEAKAAADAAATAQAVTVGDVWPRYLEEGRPKRRDAWKPGYLASIKTMSAAGGVKKRRGDGVTRSGPIYPLLALALGDVTEDALQVWFEHEAKASKHQAARALMMFRGFLRWCAARPEYRNLINRDAGKAPAILENLPNTIRRTDAIEAAQLPGWWQGVEQLSNRTASAYLKALLLTGARKEELAGLTWANVDFQWRKLTIADKVEQTRTIPLTPYLAQLLATLKRENTFVFASPGKAGRISDARYSHTTALKSAGIRSLTIHGLRRTFIQRARAVVPAGVPAQIAGHKPSATAEGYAVLSLDDLRPYAAQVEAYILSLAGVQFDAALEPGKLRVVQAV